MRLAAAPLRRPRIALTSLIDIVFLLLFFFMLASRMLDWRALPVNLAGMGDAAAPSADAIPVVVLMTDGSLRQRGEPIDPTHLLAQVEAAATRALVVVPARGVSLQQLMDALDPLQAQGVAIRLARPGGGVGAGS